MDSVEGTEESQEPVVVWEAPNQMEAQIVAGRLQSEGIPAMIRGESAGTVFGFATGSLAQADVLVPGPLAEKAREILESDVEWVDAPDGVDDEDGPVTDGEASVDNDVGASA